MTPEEKVAGMLEARVWTVSREGREDDTLEDFFFSASRSDVERAVAPLCALAAAAAALGKGAASEREVRRAISQMWAEVHFCMQPC